MGRALGFAAVGLAVALAGCGRPAAADGARAAPGADKVPQRIMSLNLCTDLLLLQVAPRSRIASVTFLAKDAAKAIGLVDDVPENRGTAEDVVRVKPDLILDSGFSSPVVRDLARRVGAKVVDVKNANNFQDIRDDLRQMGEVTGEPARADALVARMDATLAALAAHPPARKLRVVAWSGGSAAPGKDSLTDAIITAAGAQNIAAQPGAAESSFGVEELLAARPDALLYGGATLGQPSLLDDEGQHRVVRRLYAGRRIAYNDVAHTCGVPQSADSAAAIRAALARLPAGSPR